MRKVKVTKQTTFVLKGFAIMTVIFSHAGNNQLLDKIVFLKSQYVLYFLLMIGMNLFLFLSGYGLFKSYMKNGFQGYWGKKVSKILVPYWSFQIFWFLYYICARGKTFNVISTFSSIIGLNPNNIFDGSMWYISNLFFWYTIFYISLKFINNDKMAILCQLFVACIVILCGKDIWKYGYQYQLAFPCGVLFASKYISPRLKILNSNRRGVLFGAFLFACLIVVWRFLYWRSPLLDNILGIISCVLAIYFVDNIHTLFEKSYVVYALARGLENLGKVSYFLYLLEENVVVFLSVKIISNYGWEQCSTLIFLVVLSFGIVLASALNALWNRVRISMPF